MNLYLDDNVADPRLSAMLVAAGHPVTIPADFGNTGAKDPVHLLSAILHGQQFLTKNYDDFETLSDLVMGSGGHHPGVILNPEDNDRRRDMKFKDILRALGNLAASGIRLGDAVHILNDYR